MPITYDAACSVDIRFVENTFNYSPATSPVIVQRVPAVLIGDTMIYKTAVSLGVGEPTIMLVADLIDSWDDTDTVYSGLTTVAEKWESIILIPAIQKESLPDNIVFHEGGTALAHELMHFSGLLGHYVNVDYINLLMDGIAVSDSGWPEPWYQVSVTKEQRSFIEGSRWIKRETPPPYCSDGDMTQSELDADWSILNGILERTEPW